MVLNDPLANALSRILYAERSAKGECIIYPSSKIIKVVLKIMNDNKYIGSFEDMKDSKGDSIKVNLLGKINNCKAIKPRFKVEAGDIEKFERRFLPAKGFGILIISTNKGIITNAQATEKGIGGKLIAVVY